MDCSNAIGVVRVGGEVVVEARRTGKGNFYLLFGWRLFCGVVGRAIDEDFALSGPTFLKLQRIHNPVFWFATTLRTPPTPDAVARPSLRVGLT